MSSNRLLPIIAGAIMLMLVFVGIKSMNSGDNKILLDQVPTAGKPDADSPADTIRALTAEVASVKNEAQKLQIQNQELMQQRQDIENKVRAELLGEMRDMKHDEESSVFDELAKKWMFSTRG